jgi:hypothetical protein
MFRFGSLATVGLLAGTVASLHCGGDLRHTEANVGATTEAVTQTVHLGLGYDRDTFRLGETCALGEERADKQSVVAWQFAHVDDVDSAKRELGFNAEGSFAYGLAKVSAKASFARNLAETSLTSTYLLVADYTHETLRFENVRLAPESAELARVDKEQFRARCGTNFVVRADRGGRLRVATKFRFDSTTARDRFNASGGFKASKVEAQIDTSGLSESERTNSSVEVFVYQEGGLLSSLHELMNPENAVSCNLSDLAACNALIKGFLAYSTDRFPRDVQEGNARLFSHETTPYYDVSFEPLPRELEEKKLASIRAMEAHESDRLTVDYLLKSRETVSADLRRNELTALRNLLGRNMEKLTRNIVGCIETPNLPQACVGLSELNLERYTKDQAEAGLKVVVGPGIGGGGGEASQRTCATYMRGVEARAGVVLDAVRVTCLDGTSLEPVGGGGGSILTQGTCPSGQVVTGLQANAQFLHADKRTLVGGLALVCSDLARVRGGDDSPGEVRNVFGGGEGGMVDWRCPAGYVGIGLSTRAGKFVDQIALVCTNVRHVE